MSRWEGSLRAGPPCHHHSESLTTDHLIAWLSFPAGVRKKLAGRGSNSWQEDSCRGSCVSSSGREIFSSSAGSRGMNVIAEYWKFHLSFESNLFHSSCNWKSTFF